MQRWTSGAEPPRPGEVVEVAEGVLWTRFDLPFRLRAVNAYLIKDEGGWTAFDCGIDDEGTRAAWRRLLGGPLGGRLTRVIATHHHPDHVGAAAFLCEEAGAELWMSETEYLMAAWLVSSGRALSAATRSAFAPHGLDEAGIAAFGKRDGEYRRMVPRVAAAFRPVIDGQRLRIGGREVAVRLESGHSLAQVTLLAADGSFYLAADQLMQAISPNVSVEVMSPTADPLARYLDSLAALEQALADETLILAGHRQPFFGGPARCRELRHHHEARCADIVGACRDKALTAAELVPLLFPQELDPHQFCFAFSEALAHLNHLAGRGEVRRVDGGPLVRFRAV